MDVTTICGSLIETRWNGTIFSPLLFAQFLHRNLTCGILLSGQSRCAAHVVKHSVCWWWWWCTHLHHYTVKQWLPEWFGKVNETVLIISPLIIQWLMRLELIINRPTVVEAAAWREQRVWMFYCENIYLALICCSRQGFGIKKNCLKG